jgi:hypothetical protein
MSYFELGGIKVLLDSSLQITQTYEDASNSSLLEFADGSRQKQTFLPSSGKIKVTTQGRGWHGLGLSGLDWSGELLMKCVFSIAVNGVTNVIAIPSERRTDAGFEPHGYARVNDEYVATDVVSIVGDIVTLIQLPNANGYKIEYWPEIIILSEKKPAETWDNSSNDYSWSFVAFQV